MTPARSQQLAAALAVGLAMAACSGAARPVAPTSPPSPSSGPPPDAQGLAAAVARAKADSVRHAYTAADVSFMFHMIGHHAQAIVMAGWAASHGASPSVRTLAARIINAHRDEIAFMRQWLRNRLQPLPSCAAASLPARSEAAPHTPPGERVPARYARH